MIPFLHGALASNGAASAYELIESQTVGAGGSASITFTVPAGYQHIEVRMISRTNRSGVADALKVRVNGSSSANHSYHGLQGDGSAASSGYGTSLTYMPTANMAGNTASSNVFGASVLQILDYASTTKNPVMRCLGGIDNNGSGFINLFSGGRYTTGAVTSLEFSPEVGSALLQYSSFSLYGIKGA